MPKVQCSCQGCGAVFEVFPSVIRKGGGKFCSRSCQKTGEWRDCPACGERFYAQRSRIARGESSYCSRECSNPARGRAGNQNGNWKGGRFQRSDGYIAVSAGDGQYRLEHDLIMEAHIGRRLKRGEQVHHKNRVKDDNRLENLELTDWSTHIKEHHPQRRNPSKWSLVNCMNPECGVMFQKRASEIRKTKTHYCCRGCFFQGKRKGLCP